MEKRISELTTKQAQAPEANSKSHNPRLLTNNFLVGEVSTSGLVDHHNLLHKKELLNEPDDEASSVHID